MKRWHKVLLGLGSHWLFIYLPIFLGLIITLVATAPHNQDPSPLLIGGILGMVFVHILSIFFMLGTLGFLIAYAVKHSRFTSNDRILWALLLAFAGGIAGPIFFWMYIHKHPVGEPFFGTQP